MLKLTYKPLALFLAFFLIFFIAFGQHKRKHHHHSQTASHRLYICMGDLGSAADSFLKANNIQYVRLIGSASIDPNDDMIVHEDLLKAQIARFFPNPGDTGMALLDWEGKAMNFLGSASPDDPNYNVVLQKFARVLEVSKQFRPNVKWGIYSMPFRTYWNINSDWERRCMALTDLLRNSDYIAPSLYNPYRDSVSGANEQKYVDGNIQMALKIGALINKPVYPLVWHRLPNNDLIPKAEFLGHVKRILDENYNGNKVKAIIWYGEDTYMYNVKTKKMLDEVGPKENLTPYLVHLLTDYGSGIIKLLNQQN